MYNSCMFHSTLIALVVCRWQLFIHQSVHKDPKQLVGMRTSQVNDVHTDVLMTPLEKFSQGPMVIAQKGKVKLWRH